ncbi:HAD superfamily hydrolase (TIGR01509 family) [Saccharothrix tamanrassetensis]|uniref:HAD superfamily hydrolase (TIGR01509 family) n=1 Tax=Saccharothrix tamanrassetensis TaxID=1051531 RepID=A0A841CGC0_9PSEU|nr:HAD-IA family hydrolase [Saccharothrix tamanrassetensis]MBB5956043.1 HAD superfamily hydrolase (TIGR01509 family) [Saccharothrix tamanrassetensis]
MRAVIFDWRGTLVLAPTFRGWVAEALRRSGRDASVAGDVVSRLAESRLDVPGVDADAALHRETYYAMFADAGLDAELADALYEVESDVAFNPFAVDAAATLRALRADGIRIGVLSDIHFDIRPAFDGLPVDSFVLSFEHGVVKPDPAIFRIALDELGTSPGETLMVGDRATHDGAGVDVGMSTLLVPPLMDVDDARLHLVTGLVAGHAAGRRTR